MSLTKVSYSIIDGAPSNVRDFGAIGDGTTDDTAAIVAALAASNSVFLPVGTYLITSAIALANNKSIIGAGFGSILYNTTDNVTIEVSGDNTSVQSLKILGNATPVSTTLGRAAIRLGGSNITVSNVYIQDVNTGGINVASGSDICVNNFVVKNTNEHGVYISDGDRVTFTNGVIETTGQISATVGQGFRIRQSRDVTVSNVIVRDAGQHGFVLDADSSANKCERILLSNVSAQGDAAGSQMGLRITAAVDTVSVVGCRFSGLYGISVFGNVTDFPQNIFIADTTAVSESNSYPVRVVYADEIYISSGQYVTGGAVQSVYFESTVGTARVANLGEATVRADNATTYDVGATVSLTGSASKPVVGYVNDATAGLYYPTTGELGVVADGQESARFAQRTMFFGNTSATHFGRCYSDSALNVADTAFADFPLDTGTAGSFGGIAIVEIAAGTNVQMKTISLVGRNGTGFISSLQDQAVRNSGVASITLAISATSGSSLRVTNGSGGTVDRITVTVFQMVAGS